jgi:anti-anti-sigma factor
MDSATETVTLLAHGEFDCDNCDRITAYVHDALAAGRSTIIFDFRHVTFLDAATIRTLLAARAAAMAAGGSLRIVNAGRLVSRVLDITGTRAALCPAVLDAARARLPIAAEVAATSAHLIDRAYEVMADTRRILARIHADRI